MGNYLINVGYIRVSTDRQAESGYGLEIQEKDILSYCRRNELSNLLLFVDDGYTGTNMDRPALQGIISMITDFNEGKSNLRVNSMIIPRIDRLGRTLLGTLQFIQDYIVAKEDSKNSTVNQNKEDINFISVSENYCRIERSNPQGKFLLMLFASLAEFDRDLIVEKLKRGRTARVASGKWIGGGNIPYGYRYDKTSGTLVVVPEEAAKINELFRLYIEEKMSPQKIADCLGFKSDRIVTAILKRKSLTGCIVFRGKEYAGEHEAIISLERWEEAQNELKKRSVIRSDSHYLLTGLLVCGECGAKMRYQKWGNSGECKIVCYSRQPSKPYLVKDLDCPNEKFWQSDIESAVLNSLFEMSYLSDEKQTKTPSRFDTAASLAAQIAGEKKKLSRYYKLYAMSEDEDDEELIESIEDCKAKIQSLQAQMENESETQKIDHEITKAKELLNNLQSTWEFMTPQERQTVCRELVESVIIHKDGTIDVHLKLQSYLSLKN